MINGVGIDVIEIDRIRKAVLKYGDYFLKRIFTERELAYCKSRNFFKFPELAVRFAAKEAYAKAVGTGMTPPLGWKKIEVVNDKKGKPNLYINGKFSSKVSLSLSHSKDIAAAFVAIET